MPDDENWNAFEKAQSADVQHQQGLGDICAQEMLLFGHVVSCRKVHRQGDMLHEVYVNDDTGRTTVHITWR